MSAPLPVGSSKFDMANATLDRIKDHVMTALADHFPPDRRQVGPKERFIIAEAVAAARSIVETRIGETVNDEEVDAFAARVRQSIARTGAPGFEEELQAFIDDRTSAIERRAEAAERDWQRCERIVALFRTAAADVDGLTDAQLRTMVRFLSFDPPTDAEIQRTHELARKYGWE